MSQIVNYSRKIQFSGNSAFLTLNESNSSKKEYHEFLQASQNNMTEFGNNKKNNGEN